jgi:hypothetical protein
LPLRWRDQQDKSTRFVDRAVQTKDRLSPCSCGPAGDVEDHLKIVAAQQVALPRVRMITGASTRRNASATARDASGNGRNTRNNALRRSHGGVAPAGPGAPLGTGRRPKRTLPVRLPRVADPGGWRLPGLTPFRARGTWQIKGVPGMF